METTESEASSSGSTTTSTHPSSTSEPESLEESDGHKCDKFKCEICSKYYVRPSERERHALRHLALKPYKCLLCPSRRNRVNDMMRHFNRYHPAHKETHNPPYYQFDMTEENKDKVRAKLIQCFPNAKPTSHSRLGAEILMGTTVTSLDDVPEPSTRIGNNTKATNLEIYQWIDTLKVVNGVIVSEDTSPSTSNIYPRTKPFPSRLRANTRMEGPTDSYTCTVCSETLTHNPRLMHLLQHALTHAENLKRWRCVLCLEGFTRPNVAKDHFMIKHGDAIFMPFESVKADEGNEEIRAKVIECFPCVQMWDDDNVSLVRENTSERSRNYGDFDKKCAVSTQSDAPEYLGTRQLPTTEFPRSSSSGNLENTTYVSKVSEHQVDQANPVQTKLSLPVKSIHNTHLTKKIDTVDNRKNVAALDDSDSETDMADNDDGSYECKVCYKTLRRTTRKTRHAMTHVDMKAYKCLLCPTACTQANSAKHHFQVKHPGQKMPNNKAYRFEMSQEEEKLLLLMYNECYPNQQRTEWPKRLPKTSLQEAQILEKALKGLGSGTEAKDQVQSTVAKKAPAVSVRASVVSIFSDTSDKARGKQKQRSEEHEATVASNGLMFSKSANSKSSESQKDQAETEQIMESRPEASDEVKRIYEEHSYAKPVKTLDSTQSTVTNEDSGENKEMEEKHHNSMEQDEAVSVLATVFLKPTKSTVTSEALVISGYTSVSHIVSESSNHHEETPAQPTVTHAIVAGTSKNYESLTALMERVSTIDNMTKLLEHSTESQSSIATDQNNKEKSSPISSTIVTTPIAVQSRPQNERLQKRKSATPQKYIPEDEEENGADFPEYLSPTSESLPVSTSYAVQEITQHSSIQKCELCNRILDVSRATDRARHALSHMKIRPFECIVCKATFNHAGRARPHFESKHPNYRFAKFINKTSEEDKQLIRSKVDECFPNIILWDIRNSRVNSPTPKAAKGPRKNRNKDEVQHEDSDSTELHDPYLVPFTSDSERLRELETKIAINTNLQKCQICHRILDVSRTMDRARHALFHMKIKPWQCVICHESFTQAGRVKPHFLRRHPNDPVVKFKNNMTQHQTHQIRHTIDECFPNVKFWQGGGCVYINEPRRRRTRQTADDQDGLEEDTSEPVVKKTREEFESVEDEQSSASGLLETVKTSLDAPNGSEGTSKDSTQYISTTLETIESDKSTDKPEEIPEADPFQLTNLLTMLSICCSNVEDSNRKGKKKHKTSRRIITSEEFAIAIKSVVEQVRLQKTKKTAENQSTSIRVQDFLSMLKATIIFSLGKDFVAEELQMIENQIKEFEEEKEEWRLLTN